MRCGMYGILVYKKQIGGKNMKKMIISFLIVMMLAICNAQKLELTSDQRIQVMNSSKKFLSWQCENKDYIFEFVDNMDNLSTEQKGWIKVVINWECENKDKLDMCLTLGVQIAEQYKDKNLSSYQYLYMVAYDCWTKAFGLKTELTDKEKMALGLALIEKDFEEIKKLVQSKGLYNVR